MKRLCAAVSLLAALSFGVSVNMSCSSGTGGGAGGGSGGGSTGGGTGGSTGGGSNGGGTGGNAGAAACGLGNGNCNTLQPSGPYISPMYSSATMPTPAGGTPQDGTYVLSSSTVYVTDGGSGPTGEQVKHSLQFAAGVVNEVQQHPQDDGGCLLEHQTGSAVFASPMVTYTQTCPTCTGMNCGGMAGYTATSTSFTLFNSDNGNNQRVEVYNKQ